jgi:hypothetical protein
MLRTKTTCIAAAVPLAVTLALIGAPDTAAAAANAAGVPAGDVYKEVFDSVSRANLDDLLKKMTGGIPVTVEGETFSITDRYLPVSKAHFRAFWSSYFLSLGIPVSELAFDTSIHAAGESQGHDLEAVLPGKKKDSVVVIVHYDSIGPHGADNPAVDDDMTGMAMLMETARILALHQGELENTVRFVAADLEELGGLEGSRHYAANLKKTAAAQGFKIVAAVDDEQSGWNCMKGDLCSDEPGTATFDVFSCSGDGAGYDFPAVGDLLASTASSFSALKVSRGCMGQNSDHYAMWEIGVPTVVFSEHDPFDNDHFDQEGGDTYDQIDMAYYFQIAQVGVTFAAKLAGLTPPG